MKKSAKTIIYIIIVLVVLGFILYPKLKPQETGPALTAGPQRGVRFKLMGKL